MIEQKFVDLYARGKKVNLLIAERSVVLTYLLRILEDAGLSSIALKGGTCLRKVYFKLSIFKGFFSLANRIYQSIREEDSKNCSIF